MPALVESFGRFQITVAQITGKYVDKRNGQTDSPFAGANLSTPIKTTIDILRDEID